MPFWLYLLHRKNIIGYNQAGINYAVICCLIYTVATVLFSFALQDSKNPGVISALISLSPIVTMLLAHFFLDEQFTWIKGLAFLFALASVILLSL
jgi:drug/metabolite transporter (DMT)-like permease